MRVLISAEGDHDPPGQYMVVDNHGLVLDLTKVAGALVDPTILRVEWGPSVITGQPQEAGIITRRGGERQQPFYDKALLTPYINAFRAKLIALEQAAAMLVAPTRAIGDTRGAPVST